MLDPSKKRVVLVVHGVQLGEDDGLTHDQTIKALIKSRLNNVNFEVDVDIYRYENIADEALKQYKNVASLLLKSPIDKVLAKSAIDIIGDVVISLSRNTTSNTIREGLRQKILDYYQNGQAVYLMAHSLGSVYSFDVINQLIDDDDYFDRNDKRKWPCLGFLSIGSPLGLKLFKVTGRDKAQSLGKGRFPFKWLNYFDVSDPVVSGNIFGRKLKQPKIALAYQQMGDDFGWYIQDFPVDTGQYWMLSHTAYWQNAAVGDGLVNLIA